MKKLSAIPQRIKLSLLFGLFAALLQAQPLQIRPLDSTPRNAEAAARSKSSRDFSILLELPFIEDFSYKGDMPDGSKWEGFSTQVTGTMPWLPPTIGVACLDGLDPIGQPYQNTATQGPADTLMSHPINLNYPASDSIYLSFYYQPGGLGNFPEYVDSLLLEFYRVSDSTWQWVWGTKGEDYPQTLRAFDQVMIPVRDTAFLKEGFRFRFRNFAQLNGAWDQWLIDYVKLGRNRTKNDTLHVDYAFMYPATSILDTYQAEPLWHFLPQANDRMAEVYNLSFTSLGAFPANRFYGYNYYNALEQVVDFLQFENQGPIVPRQEYVLEDPVKYTYEDPGTDWTVYYLHHFLSDNTDSLSRNDTTVYTQVLSNYYALDDGSAEARIGINNNGGGYMAQRFESFLSDTLKAVQMYFNRTVRNGSTQPFYLMIWEAGNNQPGALLHQQSFTYPDTYERNNFSTIELSVPLYIPSGSYYVGIAQDGAAEINLGFDRNLNHNDRIYYNLDGNWYNYTAAEGTLMIRPLFGYSYDIYVGVPQTQNAGNWTVFPNPTNDVLYIKSPLAMTQSWALYDLSGRCMDQGLTQGVTTAIATASQPSGMYILCLGEGAQRSWKKILIQH